MTKQFVYDDNVLYPQLFCTRLVTIVSLIEAVFAIMHSMSHESAAHYPAASQLSAGSRYVH